jgi:hypothetical protein
MIQTAIKVEYASQEIGVRNYVCPVHGVAYSRIPLISTSMDLEKPAPMFQMQLNDVTFMQYHLFKSEVRIVTDGSSASEGGPAAGNEAPAAQPAPTSSTPR